MKRALLSVLVFVLLLSALSITAAADSGLEPGQIMAVKAAWGLRLRAEPDLSGRVRFVLKCGEQVRLGSAEIITADGFDWLEVEVTRGDVATVGYVALMYLTENLTPNCYLWAPGPYGPRPCPPVIILPPLQ